MEPHKTHDAICDAVDSATAGTFPSPEVSANTLGDYEAVDSASAGTFPSPEVSANMLGDYEAVDSASAGTFPSPKVSADMLGEYEVVHSATAGTPSPDAVIASTSANINSSQSQEPLTSLTRLDAYNAFVTKSRFLYNNGRPRDLNSSEKIDVVMTLFGDKLSGIKSIENHKKKLLGAIATFISKTEKKYFASKRNIHLFKKKNKDWLSKPFFNDLPKMQSSILILSTRIAEYMFLSQSQLLQNIKEEPNEDPLVTLVKAETETVLSSSSSVNLSQRTSEEIELMLKTEITETESPEEAIHILTDINKSVSAPKQPYTPEEALALIIDAKLSVSTYKIMRQELMQRGFAVFPPYHLVQVSKNECYPKEEIQINENEASVSLQGLINHTFERIIQTVDNNLTQYCEQRNLTELECIFEASWGFDGSTSQSLYKQKHSEEELDENSMFVTTFAPLRISHGDQTIWINPCPQSYRFCRPLHIQRRKETSELIKSEKSYIQNQIQRLSPSFTYTSKNHLVATSSTLTLCMIDSKDFNTITDTKSQLMCSICKLTVNNLERASSKPSVSVIKYGLSPLHCWIRVLEFLLHLSYMNDPTVRLWRIHSNSPQGKIVQERKTKIQNELKHQLGLLVDVATPNSGTTNDGNTARIALNDENRQKFAQILGIEQWLVDGLHNVLVAVNCGLPIDITKFGNYCNEIANKYVSTYGWFPMTVTIHKLLIHGKDIMDNLILPIGMLSEQAAESGNNFLRSDQEDHTNKMDMKKTMLDLFHRALETSDPVIASVRLCRQQRLNQIPLPQQVKSMLKNIEETKENYDNEGEYDTTESTVEDPEYNQSQDTMVLSREINIFEDFI